MIFHNFFQKSIEIKILINFASVLYVIFKNLCLNLHHICSSTFVHIRHNHFGPVILIFLSKRSKLTTQLLLIPEPPKVKLKNYPQLQIVYTVHTILVAIHCSILDLHCWFLELELLTLISHNFCERLLDANSEYKHRTYLLM